MAEISTLLKNLFSCFLPILVFVNIFLLKSFGKQSFWSMFYFAQVFNLKVKYRYPRKEVNASFPSCIILNYKEYGHTKLLFNDHSTKDSYNRIFDVLYAFILGRRTTFLWPLVFTQNILAKLISIWEYSPSCQSMAINIR